MTKQSVPKARKPTATSAASALSKTNKQAKSRTTKGPAASNDKALVAALAKARNPIVRKSMIAAMYERADTALPALLDAINSAKITNWVALAEAAAVFGPAARPAAGKLLNWASILAPDRGRRQVVTTLLRVGLTPQQLRDAAAEDARMGLGFAAVLIENACTERGLGTYFGEGDPPWVPRDFLDPLCLTERSTELVETYTLLAQNPVMTKAIVELLSYWTRREYEPLGGVALLVARAWLTQVAQGGAEGEAEAAREAAQAALVYHGAEGVEILRALIATSSESIVALRHLSFWDNHAQAVAAVAKQLFATLEARMSCSDDNTRVAILSLWDLWLKHDQSVSDTQVMLILEHVKPLILDTSSSAWGLAACVVAEIGPRARVLTPSFELLAKSQNSTIRETGAYLLAKCGA